MRANFARVRLLRPCLALAVTLLLVGCTTTTTVTTSDDATAAVAGTRRIEKSSHSVANKEYVVQRGDTLYAIAFRNRVDLREVIAWNDLAEPYTIYPGQRLRIGRQQARDLKRTPAESTRVTQTAWTPEPTRVALGRPIEPEPRADAAPATAPPVASLPAIPIAVDEGVREAVVDDAGPMHASSEPMAPTPPLPPVAIRTAPAQPALPQTPAEPQRDVSLHRSAPTRMVGGVGWRWPNSATLVGRYAAEDEARQGIRLQAPVGTPVSASADGEVVYSGNGLVGLGELVIIKHGAEYLSAYGLNRKRLVTEGQNVKAGEAVAEMGNSAGVAGLLHFEVRRNGRPIDPLTVLPPR